MALLKQAWRLLALTAVYGAALLGSAGTWRWHAAWAFLALTIALTGCYVLVVARAHPDLAQERVAPPADAKGWDKPLVALIGIVGPLATAVVAGLDRRFGWSPDVPPGAKAAGLTLIAAAGVLTCYSVAANRFFSAVVRIQRDRGHTVVSKGPYGVVRHPGYAASLLHMVATPFALGALGALAPVVLLVALTVVRTAMEDQTLQSELEGYREYAQRVRYRLIPGIW
jgi:protein-S-isoprenylcysteine O-methyltransferase Ste14